MATQQYTQTPPPPSLFGSLAAASEYARRLWQGLDSVRGGKMDCVRTFTLTANVASTVMSDPRLTIQSVVHFDPQTANASAEIGNGTMYVTVANRLTGAFTVTHANNAQADRTYAVSIIG